MTFPSTGLPNRATVTGTGEGTEDEDGVLEFEPVVKIRNRPARFYRDSAREAAFVRQGITVDGMVTFKYKNGDCVTEKDEVTVDGKPYGVVYASRKDLWSRPSHWEIVLTKVRP